MTDLIICWVLAPAGLLVIVLGLSLLIERLAGIEVPWTLRPALGFAVAILLAQFGTATDATAELTAPAILVLAALGLAFGYGFPTSRPDPWMGAAALLVFGVYAAPVVLSGEATWAGYIKLDDTATWLALTDHAFEFGRAIPDQLPASTHQVVVTDYFTDSYPIGAFVPAKLMSAITGQDLAWTMQPSMAFAAGVLAAVLYGLVRPLVQSSVAAFTIAVVGSLSAILIGYSLWGGTKELAAAALLPLAPALAGWADRKQWPARASVPIGIAAAGLIGILGPGGAVWLLPTLLPAFVLLIRQVEMMRALRFAGWTLVVALAVGLPALITPSGVMDPLPEVLRVESELGNLSGPLNPLHISGLWPSLDFRTDPHLKPSVFALAVICLLLAAGTVAVCARLKKGVGVPFAAYAGGGAIGFLAIAFVGSPWVDGKAMATVSPALLAAAMLGIVMIRERTQFRTEGSVLGAIVIAVVAWSAFLAYQGVWLAPRAQNAELEKLGDRFAGDGPTLVAEPSIYGPRHFLRKLDPEGATDRRSRPVSLVPGVAYADDMSIDLDQIRTDQLEPYNLVVVLRGPTQSRPPAGFALAYSGEYYEVWQRQVDPSLPAGGLLEHLPLGSQLDSGDVPNCADVQRLAIEAGTHGSLIAARTSSPITLHIGIDAATKPASWTAPTTDTVMPTESGTLTTDFVIPTAGRYELWLSGGIYGGVQLRVDGEDAGSERGQLNAVNRYNSLSTLELAGGSHRLELHYSKGGLAPGSDVTPFAVGPLILDQVSPDESDLVVVPPGDYQQLCDQRWDWIEAWGSP